jgi:hypothetical protein
MNKDNLNSNDDWKGLLASQFEDDIQVPPNKQWDAIQNELFPKKRRRFFVRWISMLILLLGGAGIIFIQKSTYSDKKVNARYQVPKGKIKSKSSGKRSLSNSKPKVDLSKNNQKKILSKRELKVDDPLSRVNVINKKTSEYASIVRNSVLTKNKTGKSPKNKVIQREKLLLVGEQGFTNKIINKIEEESIETQNSIVESIEKNEKSEEIKRDKKTFIQLNRLPIHLILMKHSLPIQEQVKKEVSVFKPFFSWQVSPLIGRNIRIISGSFNSNNTNSNAIGERRSPLPKYGFQTTLSYHINERFSFNAGFQWAGGDFQSRWFFKNLQIDPTTNDVRLKTTSGEASTTDPILIQSITNATSGIYQLRINHAFSLYSIPVGVSYRFTNQRFSPYFRSGLNLEFFGRRSLSLDVKENGTERNIELNLNRPNNRLNAQAIVALGIETRIKGNWSFFAEAGYYVPLNQFVNANGYSVRVAGSSILGGVRYEFKK